KHSFPPRRSSDLASAAGVPVPPAGEGFAELGLVPELVAALAGEGILTPFPIQAATVPDALAGRDVLGRGQTGSGKTLAFGLPMLQRLAGGQARPGRPRALVLTPTRELAMQVVDALRPLLAGVGLRHQLVAGGMAYGPQLAALERGVDLLVATPGRLTDLVQRGDADLSAVETIVLDEADHMSQLGFLEPVTALLKQIPADGQRLLFSATLDHGVDALVADHLTDPVTHATDAATASVATMEHHALLVHPHDKRHMVAALAARRGRTLIFARTKLGADRVALQLREAGVMAAALHGGLGQAARTRVLGAFRGGELPVLVATDVAARGIHVDDVSLVLQIDPPTDPKDYLHRAGRTARAGDRGAVVTLALPHQRRTVSRLLESAGVHARLQSAGPEDALVGDIAGERAPTAEPVTEQQLSDLLRPRRSQRTHRPGGKGRPHGGRQHRPAGRYQRPGARRQDAGGGAGGGLRSRA
ncbi:DEAD/DEAH box helicase, partial [Ornithinicoccus halotolerans]|uniref:DEAD/DEAH box helicase n=1 Tax=Ornithinicoccus halotolerans TaxID=1748220 RepID=UPI001E5BC1BC